MIAKLTEARWLCETLGEIFCLTFVRGVDAAEVLRRMGGYPDTFTELGPEEIFERQNSYLAGYPQIASAVELGGWTVVLEPNGFAGVGTLLTAVSQGTEAVAVLRHDYAHPRFAYAVDGTVLTAFDPGRIDEVTGTGTGRLGAHLEQVRRAPVDQSPDSGGAARDATRAVVLAGLVTGVLPTPNALSGPMLTAQFEPWFTSAAPEDGGLSMSVAVRDPQQVALLIDAVSAASPAAKRTAAVAEVRRIADHLGVAGTPGLRRALADAEAGRFRRITTSSPLGLEVRAWLRRASTASGSLNDPTAPWLTEAERFRSNLFGWLARALRGALYPDPDVAVRTALYALSVSLPALSDPQAYAAALSHLRS